MRRFCRWLVLITIFAVWKVTAATTTAPAKSDDDPERGIKDQLDSGRDLLDAGKWKDALEAFRKASATSARSVTALHGQGVAALQMNDDGFAAGVLDKAVAASSQPTRALVYNAAVARVRTNQPIAAAQVLRSYLALPSAANDEPLLDALQVALRRADDAAEDPQQPQARTGSIMDQLKDLHDFANGYREKLEAQRPGLKRWGNMWLPAAEADAKRSRLMHAQSEVEATTRGVAEQEAIVQQRAAALEHSRENGHLTGAVGRHRDELNHAKKVLDERMSKLDRLHRDIQSLLPPLPASLSPIGIDDDTAPPITGTSSSSGSGAGGGHRKKGKH